MKGARPGSTGPRSCLDMPMPRSLLALAADSAAPCRGLWRQRRPGRGRGRRRPSRPGPGGRLLRGAAEEGSRRSRLLGRAPRRNARDRKRALARPSARARLHRELVRSVQGHPCAAWPRRSTRTTARSRLLGVVAEDDAEPAKEYAADLDLGHPVAVANEHAWLSYAAREPPVVVVVSKGGKVLRGFPGGVTPQALAPRLEELLAHR